MAGWQCDCCNGPKNKTRPGLDNTRLEAQQVTRGLSLRPRGGEESHISRSGPVPRPSQYELDPFTQKCRRKGADGRERDTYIYVGSGLIEITSNGS